MMHRPLRYHGEGAIPTVQDRWEFNLAETNHLINQILKGEVAYRGNFVRNEPEDIRVRKIGEHDFDEAPIYEARYTWSIVDNPRVIRKGRLSSSQRKAMHILMRSGKYSVLEAWLYVTRNIK